MHLVELLIRERYLAQVTPELEVSRPIDHVQLVLRRLVVLDRVFGALEHDVAEAAMIDTRGDVTGLGLNELRSLRLICYMYWLLGAPYSSVTITDG